MFTWLHGCPLGSDEGLLDTDGLNDGVEDGCPVTVGLKLGSGEGWIDVGVDPLGCIEGLSALLLRGSALMIYFLLIVYFPCMLLFLSHDR